MPATYAARRSRDGSVAQVIAGDGLGHDHAPRVEYELAQFVRFERGEPDDHPVVAKVRRLRHEELGRLGLDERLAFLLREGEAHHRLVAREGEAHDATHAELDRKSTRLNSSHLVISYAVF